MRITHQKHVHLFIFKNISIVKMTHKLIVTYVHYTKIIIFKA